ncbi:MAG: hypothetical protein M3137_17255 [Actinomycetota bacterium]|nr:hypothetical protein [Actinomycetota bacterium]
MVSLLDADGEIRPSVHDDVRPWSLSTLADRVMASDPGLNRLRFAALPLLSIAAAMVVEWLFVHATGALWLTDRRHPLPPALAARIQLQHHGIVVIAVLMGAIMAMLSGFGVSDKTIRGQLVTLVLLPIPVVPPSSPVWLSARTASRRSS